LINLSSDPNIDILKIKVEKDWTVNEFKDYFTAINNVYNIILAGVIKTRFIKDLYRHLTYDLEASNKSASFDDQHLLAMVQENPIKDISKNLNFYVYEIHLLKIKSIIMESSGEIYLQGLGEIIDHLGILLQHRSLKKLEKFLDMELEYPDHPLLKAQGAIIMIKLRKKLLKEIKKFEKLKSKYTIPEEYGLGL